MKRLIDIDRFLRTLNKVVHVSELETMSKVAETMAFMIETQWSLFPEEIREPKWIPVTERLPEKAGKYLVTVTNGNVYAGTFDKFSGRFQCAAVAWMPLPEPYKENKDERD